MQKIKKIIEIKIIIYRWLRDESLYSRFKICLTRMMKK